ncbi:DNA-directed RNA polymerase I subunit RPA34 [Liasis olivaceus]
MAAPAEGPPRFRCPEEFRARSFAPGPAFRPEALRGPARQLLLIRAPASFSPDSLTGRTVPLLGSRAVEASPPDGARAAYSLRVSRGDAGSSARLLIPSGRPDRLACAPPFAGCLSIRETRGDPGAAPALLPVADRPAPLPPEGLRQRFFPFGGWPERPPPPSGAPAKAARKKSGKRQPQAAEGEAAEHRGLLSGEEEGPRRRKSRKPLPPKSSGETEERPDPDSRGRQPEPGPRLQEGTEPGAGGGDHAGAPALGGCRPKRQRRHQQEAAAAEGLQDVATGEDAGGLAWLGGFPEVRLGSAKEELGEELPSCKKKKKKKKEKRKAEEKGDEVPLQEQGAETQFPGSNSVVLDWDAPGVPLRQEVGPEEPLQPNGVAPNQRPKKKRKGEGKREDWAGLSTAGT